MSVFKGSRYTMTPAYKRDGDTLMLRIRKRAKFDPSKASYHTFIEGDTLDCIAFKKYGSAQLWWAILDANPQYQSELEINAGDIIAIPNYQEVVKYIV